MKTWLLIAGDRHYPERATGDWIACYATEELAMEACKALIETGQYDWIEVINLMEWMS